MSIKRRFFQFCRSYTTMKLDNLDPIAAIKRKAAQHEQRFPSEWRADFMPKVQGLELLPLMDYPQPVSMERVA